MKTNLKNIFNPGTQETHTSVALLVLRVAVGSFMLTHGIGKMLMLFSDQPIAFPDPIGLGFTVSLTLAFFAEAVCSVLLILGIATRASTLPLLVTMFIAGFIIHAADPFMVKELALLYFTIYSVLLITGAGKYSLDYLIYRK